jgi:hypothetical protein
MKTEPRKPNDTTVHNHLTSIWTIQFLQDSLNYPFGPSKFYKTNCTIIVLKVQINWLIRIFFNYLKHQKHILPHCFSPQQQSYQQTVGGLVHVQLHYGPLSRRRVDHVCSLWAKNGLPDTQREPQTLQPGTASSRGLVTAVKSVGDEQLLHKSHYD